MKKADVTLYLVTNREGMEEAEFLHRVEGALKGGVTLLQLREKEAEGREFYTLARKVKDLAKAYGVPLLIDDRTDIALAVDADGVHVGQRDLPVEAARRILGPNKIVGATAKPWNRPWRRKRAERTIWEWARCIRRRQR
jgi:thiamine-phosphate pyrophosphorylase